MNEETINKKIKANAVSAYLLLFVCIFFIFNKNNKYLNNDFVKNHAKTAFFIHLVFLVIYIIFIHYWLFQSLVFFGFSINLLLVSILFLANFWLLIFWISRANNEEYFKIWEIFKMTNSAKLIDLSKWEDLNEKDKLTIILSYIPFISYIIYHRFEKSPKLRDTTKFNFIISFIILSIFVIGNGNLALLLFLLYIIFIVFASLNLITKDEILSFNLSFLPRIRDSEIYLKSFFRYIKNYLKGWKDFSKFNDLLNHEIEENLNKETLENTDLANKVDTKLPKILIYIPIINFIFLFSLNTKQRNHIINWLSLSIIWIILFILSPTSSIFYMFLFPICFWIWYTKSNPTYKMPIIYHVFNTLLIINNKIKSLFWKTKEIKNTTKEVKFTIEDKKII